MKLTLGTANFGLDYGFKNNFKRLDNEAITSILDLAEQYDIPYIDTAKAYGSGEKLLGNYLQGKFKPPFGIITKLNDLDAGLQELHDSLKHLRIPKLSGLLLHDFKKFKDNPGIWHNFVQAKKEGLTDRIGFSLYYPDDLISLLDCKVEVDFIQIAYSIFDRRFEKHFQILHDRKINIHVRSVFLQGLFFKNPEEIGTHFNSVKHYLKDLHDYSLNYSLSIEFICLSFVAINKYVDQIIVGVDSTSDLISNINNYKQSELIVQHLDYLDRFKVDDINILFPHFWRL